MKKLAAFIVSRRLTASACCASFAALANFFPPIFILANASVALYTMQKGLRSSLPMVAVASLLLSVWFVMLHQLGGPDEPFLKFYVNTLALIFLLWLPFLLLAWVLRLSDSLSLVFQITAALGVLALAIAAGVIDDPLAFWDRVFTSVLQDEFMQAIQSSAEAQQTYLKVLSIMSAALMAGALLLVLSSILLARWWQSLLRDSISFKREFLGLQLGRFYSAAAIALMLVSFSFELTLARDFSIVLMVPLLFQGISTVHFFLDATKQARTWLSVFYVALCLATFMLPVVLQLLALLAIAEALFNLRAKASAAT